MFRLVCRAIRRTSSRKTNVPQPQRRMTGPAFQIRSWINSSNGVLPIMHFCCEFRAKWGLGLQICVIQQTRLMAKSFKQIIFQEPSRFLPTYQSPFTIHQSAALASPSRTRIPIPSIELVTRSAELMRRSFKEYHDFLTQHFELSSRARFPLRR